LPKLNLEEISALIQKIDAAEVPHFGKDPNSNRSSDNKHKMFMNKDEFYDPNSNENNSVRQIKFANIEQVRRYTKKKGMSTSEPDRFEFDADSNKKESRDGGKRTTGGLASLLGGSNGHSVLAADGNFTYYQPEDEESEYFDSEESPLAHQGIVHPATLDFSLEGQNLVTLPQHYKHSAEQ
jgi:hypothetical protein